MDEIDGSDPHAQRKILDWIKDPERQIPILCTANETPIIFKRATEYMHIYRCMPLNAKLIYDVLKQHLPMQFSEFQVLVKECQFDVRRILNRVQYGMSDKPQIVTMSGDSIIDLLKQEEMFYEKDPITLGLESIGF